MIRLIKLKRNEIDPKYIGLVVLSLFFYIVRILLVVK